MKMMDGLQFVLDRIQLRKPPGIPGSAVPAILIGLFVAFGGILFGYDTGSINGILDMQQWRDIFSTGYRNPKSGRLDITSGQKSLIVSILSAGTFIGALTAAPVADQVGRRWGLISACIIFVVGVALQLAATGIPLFVTGRFFAGSGVGLVSTLIPLYQSETAPKWIRGFIVGAYQFSITLGLLFAAIVDNATKNRPDTGSFRIPLGVQIAWSIVLVVGMFALPETPRYLIKINNPEAARRSLARLRRLPVNSPHLAELSDIAQHHERALNSIGHGYLDCLKGNLGKRLATGCLLQAFQQLTGINFIFYYGTSYFTGVGIPNAFTISLIANLVNVLATIPGLYMVEKWGRRPLLLFGVVGMTISLIIVASVGSANLTNGASNKVQIAFICFFIIFFACSWGPVVWVIPGELYPLQVRAKCMSLSTASNWIVNWGVAYAIPYMIDSGSGNLDLGARVFYLWAGCCVLAGVLVWGLVYETKNLSLEQVDELYDSVPHAWESRNFVPTQPRHSLRPWSATRKIYASPMVGYACHIEANPSSPTPTPLDNPERPTENGLFGMDYDPELDRGFYRVSR